MWYGPCIVFVSVTDYVLWKKKRVKMTFTWPFEHHWFLSYDAKDECHMSAECHTSFLCPSSLLLGKRQEVRIWIDISMVAMERILILDQSQSGHFRRGLSRWQSSNWLRASLVGSSTAETCRCHIVLVVTNPITPGSLGRSSLQCSTWMHLRKQRNTWWKGYSLLGLEEEFR